MRLIPQSDICLESFSIREKLNDVLEFDLSSVDLDSFNLLIGNNAQGKTRLFRILKFIKNLLLAETRQKISSHFVGQFVFRKNTNEKLEYFIHIFPSNEGNNYVERITKNEKILLSTDEKKLFDEGANKYLDNFFVPQNIPAIAAINESRFESIKLIREFFLRMLFVDSAKNRNIRIEPNAKIPNSLGINLSSVLNTWRKSYLEAYTETIDDFKRCFSLIKEVTFAKPSVSLGLVPLPPNTELLAIKEEDVEKLISELDWSDGLWRALLIICLPKTPFEFDGVLYPPSLICIDEIENGLDFNALEFITEYLKDYSEHIQIIVSSHSPLMGKFVHPTNWQIVKRKGAKIKISKPSIIEGQDGLKEKLDLYRQEYWDFYSDYVSGSKLYEPK